MANEVETLERKLEEMRDDVRTQFAEVRDDLKELTKALRELIRLDGDIRRLQDACGRIGRESEDHEKRLRALEQTRGADAMTVKHLDRTQWLQITTVVSIIASVIAGVAVWGFTH